MAKRGRPASYRKPDAKRELISLRIDDELLRRLDRERRRTPRGEWIREAIVSRLDDAEPGDAGRA